MKRNGRFTMFTVNVRDYDFGFVVHLPSISVYGGFLKIVVPQNIEVMDDHLSNETHGFGDTQFEETTKMSVKPCL
jgi:hypothetical protein